MKKLILITITFALSTLTLSSLASAERYATPVEALLVSEIADFAHSSGEKVFPESIECSVDLDGVEFCHFNTASLQACEVSVGSGYSTRLECSDQQPELVLAARREGRGEGRRQGGGQATESGKPKPVWGGGGSLPANSYYGRCRKKHQANCYETSNRALMMKTCTCPNKKS